MQNIFCAVDLKPFQKGNITMKDLQGINQHSAVSSSRPRFKIPVLLSLCIMFTFILSACSGNIPSSVSAASIVHASKASTTTVASTVSTPTSYPVKVFFSRFPESVSANNSAVYPVDRISPTIAVGTFALQLLIARVTAEINATLKQFPRIKKV